MPLSDPRVRIVSCPGAAGAAEGLDDSVPLLPSGWNQPDHPNPPQNRCQSRLSPPRTNRSRRPAAQLNEAGSPVMPEGGAPSPTQGPKPLPFDAVQYSKPSVPLATVSRRLDPRRPATAGEEVMLPSGRTSEITGPAGTP